MTRSLAPRRPEKALKAAPKPDPTTILYARCCRCDRLIWTRGTIPLNCHHCGIASAAIWPDAPLIEGGVSGA